MWDWAVFAGKLHCFWDRSLIHASEKRFGNGGEDLLKLFHAPSVVFLIYLLGNFINELSYDACGDVHCYLFQL